MNKKKTRTPGVAHPNFKGGITGAAGFERKFIPLSNFKGLDDADGPGHLEGYVNVFGNLDDGGDIVLGGAYDDDLIARFLKGGFFAESHNWDVAYGQIGYPMTAKADDVGLWVVNKFHSTADAQDVRTKARERQADGKEIGLSIGYKPGAVIYIAPKDYDSLLPKYLKAEYLSEGMEKAKQFPRVRVLPKIDDLAESSIVTRAMNTLAMAASVKSGDGVVEGDTEETDEANGEHADATEGTSGEQGEQNQTPSLFEHTGDAGDPPAGEDPPVQPPVPGVKIGARNSETDVRRIQSIHDMATELHNEVCPGYDSGKGAAKPVQVRISDRIKQLFSNAHAKLKSIFGDALAESMAPSPWQIFYALLEARDQIADLQEAAEGTSIPVDPEALIDEALAEMVLELKPALMRSLDQIANAPTYIYYGLPPAELKTRLLLSDLASKSLEDNSLAVVTAVQELLPVSASVSDAVAAFVDRANEKQEFRNADGRTVSESVRGRKAEMDQGLQAARDKILTAVEKGETLTLLAPEDLRAEFRKLKLQTERLRTNALASHQ